MSKHQEHRISRRAAARMPSGSPVTVPDVLADLLAAAAAPPRDGELVRRAGRSPATRPAPTTRPVPRTRIAPGRPRPRI